jgi:plasmid maintenance system antidote protein VapI
VGRPRHKIEYPPRVFKNSLAQLISDRGVDVRQLASVVNITPATMQRIVEGTDVRLTVAQKVAAYFGKSVDEVWETA